MPVVKYAFFAKEGVAVWQCWHLRVDKVLFYLFFTLIEKKLQK